MHSLHDPSLPSVSSIIAVSNPPSSFSGIIIMTVITIHSNHHHRHHSGHHQQQQRHSQQLSSHSASSNGVIIIIITAIVTSITITTRRIFQSHHHYTRPRSSLVDTPRMNPLHYSWATNSTPRRISSFWKRRPSTLHFFWAGGGALPGALLLSLGG